MGPAILSLVERLSALHRFIIMGKRTLGPWCMSYVERLFLLCPPSSLRVLYWQRLYCIPVHYNGVEYGHSFIIIIRCIVEHWWVMYLPLLILLVAQWLLNHSWLEMIRNTVSIQYTSKHTPVYMYCNLGNFQYLKIFIHDNKIFSNECLCIIHLLRTSPTSMKFFVNENFSNYGTCTHVIIDYNTLHTRVHVQIGCL